MRIRNQPDFLSGLLFLTIGAAAALYARRYDIGTAYQMGSGYFPVLLGVILAIIGLLVTVRSVLPNQDQEFVEYIHFKPMLLILGSIVAFGAMLFKFGFLISATVLVVVSSLASKEFSLRYVIPTAFALVVGCYLIFIYGLGLPIPVWVRG